MIDDQLTYMISFEVCVATAEAHVCLLLYVSHLAFIFLFRLCKSSWGYISAYDRPLHRFSPLKNVFLLLDEATLTFNSHVDGPHRVTSTTVLFFT